MDASLTISVGSILAFVGFLFQIGITIGAVAFSHGQINQRVRVLEEKVKDQNALATSVTRLETEMESVGREIKGLREDLRLTRAELRNELHGAPSQPQQPPRRVRPYDFPGAREWILEDEQR